MYAFFAHIGGDWGFVGSDEHEDCAVMFIDFIDKTFGEGSAYVIKMPERSPDQTPAGVQQHVAMSGMLTELESGAIDLDAEFRKFNAQRGHD